MAAAAHMVAAAFRAAASQQKDPQDITLRGPGKTFFMECCRNYCHTPDQKQSESHPASAYIVSSAGCAY